MKIWGNLQWQFLVECFEKSLVGILKEFIALIVSEYLKMNHQKESPVELLAVKQLEKFSNELMEKFPPVWRFPIHLFFVIIM